MKINKLIKLAAVLAAFSFQLSALASLTAVVTPGYQFPTDGSVAPSFDLLNQLALPSIAIYGTIGGSNTISPGSITTVSFSSTVADQTTIGFNGNSPAGLQVLAAGIAGSGLKAASTTTLKLSVDTNYFNLATNTPANTNTSATIWLTFKTNWLDGVPATTNAPNTNVFLVTAWGQTGGASNTAAQLVPLSAVLAQQPAAGALCRWNGKTTGTTAAANLWRSLNVSNVIRTATGKYTINFSNSFPNTNYIVDVATFVDLNLTGTVTAVATNSVNIEVSFFNGGTTDYDATGVYLSIFP